jgi:hypothetical protein
LRTERLRLPSVEMEDRVIRFLKEVRWHYRQRSHLRKYISHKQVAGYRVSPEDYRRAVRASMAYADGNGD